MKFSFQNIAFIFHFYTLFFYSFQNEKLSTNYALSFAFQRNVKSKRYQEKVMQMGAAWNDVNSKTIQLLLLNMPGFNTSYYKINIITNGVLYENKTN